IEALLRGVGAERDDLVVAMRAPAGLHHVGLRGEGGEPGGRPPSLHVNEYTRGLSHGGIADVFHHEREARPGRDGKCLGAAPDCALQGDRGSQFVFHLNERSADGGHTRGEAFNDFGGRGDGIASRKESSGSEGAFAASMVAVNEVSAGKNAARISLHRAPPWRKRLWQISPRK